MDFPRSNPYLSNPTELPRFPKYRHLIKLSSEAYYGLMKQMLELFPNYPANIPTDNSFALELETARVEKLSDILERIGLGQLIITEPGTTFEPVAYVSLEDIRQTGFEDGYNGDSNFVERTTVYSDTQYKVMYNRGYLEGQYTKESERKYARKKQPK